MAQGNQHESPVVNFPSSTEALPKQKFYITTPGTTLTWKQPVIVYADDRLSADMALGLTVWTEDEWKEYQKYPPALDSNGKRMFNEPIEYKDTRGVLMVKGSK